MWSLISVPLCAALLSTASPLGDRALFRKHSGIPLSRRFILSSRYDVPAACAALPTSNATVSTYDPSTVTSPIMGDNSTIAAPFSPDNSTVTAPLSSDNSTVADNSTIADSSTVADNSTLSNAPLDTNSTTTDTADNSTVVRRYGYSDFWESWFDLCASGAGDIYDATDLCYNYGLDGLDGLLAGSDVCAQQEAADAMITFAKSRGVVNSQDLINLAVEYRKLPRESVEIMGFYPSTPYCTVAPVNDELCGIWNEQPEGVTVGLYGGPSYPIVSFGDDSSCPYGQTPDVMTCSCMSSVYTPESSGLNSTYFSGDYATATDSTDSDMTVTSVAAEPTCTDSDTASALLPTETTASDSTSDAASSTSDVASSTAASASATADVAAASADASVENAPSGR